MAGAPEPSVGVAGILRRSERGPSGPAVRPRAEEMSTRTLIILAALCAVAILAASAAQILLAR